MIVNGDVALGEWLTEREVAANLNVSKTPVREAFAQLQIEGLVKVAPRSGVHIFEMDAAEIQDFTTSVS